jgi:hypothetical protein
VGHVRVPGNVVLLVMVQLVNITPQIFLAVWDAPKKNDV